MRPSAHMQAVTLRIAVIGTIIIAGGLVGCGSDEEKAGTPSSAASTDESTDESSVVADGSPFVPGPGVTPAGIDDITATADVRALLDQLGFPQGWPLPDGITGSDVGGLSVRQSGSDERTTFTYGFAFVEPSGDADERAAEWYERYADHLGIEQALITGTRTANDVSGMWYSGGLPDEPAGQLSVIGSSLDGGALLIEAELKLEVAAATPTLQLAPALLEQLPDLTECSPSLISAELNLHPSPNHPLAELGYGTILEGTCSSRAALDAAIAWAEGRDGTVTQDEDHIEVTNTSGADGTLIHVGAYPARIRVDTDQAATG